MTSKGGSPPLDILVRTSGVKRLSDYLLWQVSDWMNGRYSHLHVLRPRTPSPPPSPFYLREHHPHSREPHRLHTDTATDTSQSSHHPPSAAKTHRSNSQIRTGPISVCSTLSPFCWITSGSGGLCNLHTHTRTLAHTHMPYHAMYSLRPSHHTTSLVLSIKCQWWTPPNLKGLSTRSGSKSSAPDITPRPVFVKHSGTYTQTQ